MRIDVWSDLVCPWCYIGKRRLEHALEQFEHRAAIDVVHRSFQLHPEAPSGGTISRREMLKHKYSLSDDEVVTMDERLERLAAEDGLDYDLSGDQTGNTIDAHRLAHLGRAHGCQDQVVERLFRAHFTEQRSIFDRQSLIELGADAGLDPTEVAEVIDSNRFLKEVRDDQDEANLLGSRGVPFFVLAGRYAISGAQPLEAFSETLGRAWNATHAPAAG
jgi:predicted DsbA family dithiol-disulfide isomerase